MNSIAQDETLTADMQNFFKKYGVVRLLRFCGIAKSKGIPAIDLFSTLFSTVFTQRSLYTQLCLHRDSVVCGKDAFYRFMGCCKANWCKFTTYLSAAVIKMTILHLTDDQRENVLIIDDSMYRRTYSVKTELMCKCYDHCRHAYDFGFRLLTLGWSDGNTFLPVNFCLMSSANPDKRINEARVDSRTNGGKQRKRAMDKTTETMLELLKDAKKAAIPAKYLLCDSWFTFPSVIVSVKQTGYDVIGMVRKSSKFHFIYGGIKQNVMEIYKQNRKRRGKSKYLLCVDAVVKTADGEIPVRFVYVRNRSNRKDYRVIISTDTSLPPEEIIRIYGKRWDIEVFFKICKSYLRLEKECRSISYDTLTAHVAIVFSRYMLLAVRHREENDLRSIGVLFQICVEELADLQYAEALQRIFKEFAAMLSKELDVDERLISTLLETFICTLPAEWQRRLAKCAA